MVAETVQVQPEHKAVGKVRHEKGCVKVPGPEGK